MKVYLPNFMTAAGIALLHVFATIFIFPAHIVVRAIVDVFDDPHGEVDGIDTGVFYLACTMGALFVYLAG